MKSMTAAILASMVFASIAGAADDGLHVRTNLISGTCINH